MVDEYSRLRLHVCSGKNGRGLPALHVTRRNGGSSSRTHVEETGLTQKRAMQLPASGGDVWRVGTR
jgi:hypothetical protein